MTIRKGEPWGQVVRRPRDLVVVDDDAALADRLVASGSDASVAVSRGDVWRTVGGREVDGRSELQRLPLDLVRIRLDDGTEHHAVAHVVARSPWWRGGFLRGPVTLVMNAEWLGELDVAPRGHPNDGRVETFRLDPGTTLRQRLAIRRRMRSGTHLPHPAIATGSVREATVDHGRPMVVVADGRRVGRARRVDVTVLPDAGALVA